VHVFRGLANIVGRGESIRPRVRMKKGTEKTKKKNVGARRTQKEEKLKRKKVVQGKEDLRQTGLPIRRRAKPLNRRHP